MANVRNGFLCAFFGLLLVTGLAAPAAASTAYGPTGSERADIREIAREEVISRNIDPTAIRGITIDRRIQSRQDGGRVIGFNAWVRLEGCDRGYVVVQMSRRGTVQQAYGYDGCHPPGF